MNWTLIYGLLIALGVLAIAWFAVIVPSEKRDHERRLALIRKRLAQRATGIEKESDESRKASSPARDK